MLVIQAFFYYNIIMKEEYRKKYLEIRKNIINKREQDDIIYNRVISDKKINKYNTLLIYVSLKDEVDTIKIIKYYLKSKKKLAVPKVEKGTMNFYYINSLDDLKLGYFNVLEPTSNNIVTDFTNVISITPGICFSKELYRLGYGKGFYDKFYAQHKEIYKIGICYKECYLDTIPHDENDIKLDEIITTKTKKKVI